MILFPGSFDPFTLAHADLVERGVALFGKVVVAVGNNIDKSSMMTPAQRKAAIERLYEGNDSVEVVLYDGLTVDLCRAMGCKRLLRGVRSVRDFEYEEDIALANRILDSDIETVLLFTRASLAGISSSAVRQIVAHGGDATDFLPKN